MFAIPTRFHGVKFCPNLSGSQILVQTIQIISDNGVLNLKPKSIIFESRTFDLKIFEVKISNFWAVKNCKTNSLEKFCLFERYRKEDVNRNVSTISCGWSMGAQKNKRPTEFDKIKILKRSDQCIVSTLCFLKEITMQSLISLLKNLLDFHECHWLKRYFVFVWNFSKRFLFMKKNFVRFFKPSNVFLELFFSFWENYD